MTRSLELLVLRLGARILLRELQLMDTDARAAAREVSLLLEAALGLAGVLGGHRRVSRQTRSAGPYEFASVEHERYLFSPCRDAT